MIENDDKSSPVAGSAGEISDRRFLRFSLHGRQYALPLLKVKEVLALAEVTPVPQTPPYMKGIMNLRGQVISVIDLKMKLQLPSSPPSQESAIVILDINSGSVGIIVDSVDDVFAMDANELQPATGISSTLHEDCTLGVVNHQSTLVIILDIDRTLNVTELRPNKTSRHVIGA